MSAMESALREFTKTEKAYLHAWCILPNHYHLLITCESIQTCLSKLGQVHGRFSYQWNQEDKRRGRRVFFGAAEREIRSERHHFATLNYIHHNPVHHGYVKKWLEWPWSSAADFLNEHGREEAKRIWTSYPIRDYGAKWDPPRRNGS
jgi:putative transposase